MDSRTASLLKLLRTPKTYQELSDEVGVGYYTVRQHVQSLIDLGFVEEMPWPKPGTNQKTFRSCVHNAEKEFTEEGCSTFKYVDDKYHTALDLLSMDSSILQALMALPHLALSAPMWEYRASTHPSEAFTNTQIPSNKIVDKLVDLRTLLIKLQDFVEQLIAVGTWDPADPELNKILFHKNPDKINWDEIKAVYSRLGHLAAERNW